MELPRPVFVVECGSQTYADREVRFSIRHPSTPADAENIFNCSLCIISVTLDATKSARPNPGCAILPRLHLTSLRPLPTCARCLLIDAGYVCSAQSLTGPSCMQCQFLGESRRGSPAVGCGNCCGKFVQAAGAETCSEVLKKSRCVSHTAELSR